MPTARTSHRAWVLITGLVIFLLLAAHTSLRSGARAAPSPALTTSDLAALSGDPITPTVYLPMVAKPRIPPVRLQNAGFENGIWRETLNGTIWPEIAVPDSWIAFWNESADYGRPEMSIIPQAAPYLTPPRVYAGDQGLKWFTFYRMGDVGVLQQIAAGVGVRYQADAYVHVWYSQRDDASISQWVDDRTDIVYPISNGDPGMMSMIGIDPTGGTDPWDNAVIWEKAHIYDQFEKISVQATAKSPTITVFIRSQTLYPFKHCDAYWDEISVSIIQ